MDNNNPSNFSVRFAGFVCFWNMPRRSGESTRQRFFSIYQDLRLTLQQHSSESNLPQGKCDWKMVRISEAGKKFLGLVRR
jgi:hypothetical protein